MKHLLSILTFLLICFMVAGQTTVNDPEAIKKKMAEIRRSTDWNDPEEAKKANAEIEALAVKLTQAIRAKNAQVQPGQAVSQENENNDQDAAALIRREIDDFNNDLWSQMMKIARERNDKWDMADPLREEIVEEYLEDETPSRIRPEVLEAMTVLVLDMTIPTVQRIIDVMPNFKAIETLIITGGDNGVPVNLPEILRNASGYPLKNLYIFNFKNYVSDIPAEINTFAKLSTVALFNNNLRSLPDMNNCATSIDTLLIDVNPVSTLFPGIESFIHLKKLGIARTSVSETEVERLEQLFPDCTIVTK